MRPRTIKILRDLRIAYGRVAVMTIAIAVAVTGFGAILIAKEALTRDAQAAYTDTNPAAASLDVPDGVDAELLARIRDLPGVADATARQTVVTRTRVGDAWYPLLLFVVPTGDPDRIATVTPQTGAWPPADGVVLERAATGLLQVETGGSLRVVGSDGELHPLGVTGTVWDPALAPASQERTGYAFVSPATLELLGFTALNDRLLLTVEDPQTRTATRDQATVDAVAASVADWLEAEGHAVHEVTAPPYRHPHQNQTDTVTNLLVAFALAALALAAVLVASTLGGMLAAQTRQIGVMKTVGATSGIVLRSYLGMTAVIAAVATAVAIAPAVAAGVGLADLVAGILNIDIVSRSASPLALVLIVAAGILVPLLVALVPITRAARVTVREAISDFEVSGVVGTRGLDRLLSRAGGGDRIPVFAARNLLRRPQRFVATVALLASGGALFLAGINSSEAWSRWVDEGLSKRSYDVQLSFAEPIPQTQLATVLNGLDGVESWEGIVSLPSTPAGDSGETLVQRVYPDGGHGTFATTAVDPATDLIHFDLRRGEWLRPGADDEVVLNQAASTRLGDPDVGSTVAVSVEGVVHTWTVVGVVDEVGGAATAYVAAGSIDTAVGGTDLATAIRVVAPDDTARVIEAVEDALVAAGIPLGATVPTSELETAIDQHVVVFIAVLVALAVLMAIIGALGLASAMTISVTERIREFGIMKAIGASPGVVRRLVLSEGVITGLVGFVLAAALSLPASIVVGSTLGRLAFNLPLPLVISGPALAFWAVIAIAGAALASMTAALRSARLTVRQSLAHQ
jgi:putative ABC transport system permease protein